MENKKKIYLMTRTEIVKHLEGTQDAVGSDVKTLRSWELGQIDTAEAIRQLIKHNNMTNKISGISEEAFHDFARKIGYIRING
jgi:hypothetical protein